MTERVEEERERAADIHGYSGGEHYNSVVSLKEKNRRSSIRRTGCFDEAREDLDEAREACSAGRDSQRAAL